MTNNSVHSNFIIHALRSAVSFWGNLFVSTTTKEFNRLIPNSELHFVDKCGHAPMMEVPEEFNRILTEFLTKLKTPAATV